jgi:glyoxylase-like metal-dependent hydrolase (beta-lactamase superfamily II)
MARGRGANLLATARLRAGLDSSWRLFAFGLKSGALPYPAIRRPQPLADGETLDLPGRPRVLHTPGHTAGSTSFFLEGHSALISGDELVTVDDRGGVRARLSPRPFNADHEQARASLERLDGLEASLVLPGHGPPHRTGLPAALAEARERR